MRYGGQYPHTKAFLYLCAPTNDLPHMKYALIALDLDGTLTNSQKEISTRNRDCLLRAQAQGLRLVLASGRPTYGIQPLAESLELARYGGFILAYNGGEIIDCATQTTLYQESLPNDVIALFDEAAQRHQLTLLGYDGPTILTTHPDDIYVQKEAFLNKMQVRQTASLVDQLPLPATKCLMVGDPERLVLAEAELQTSLGNRVNVFRSEPYFLELVAPGIDKARSLRKLLQHLSLEPSQLIAMGDGYNDLSMIELAGLGIAMENAQAPVKAAADYIAPSNDADGVAVALAHYLSL